MGRLVVAAAAPIAPVLPAGAGAVLAGGQGGGGVLMRGSVSSVLINSPRQARALIQAGAGPRALIIPTRQPMPSIVAAGSRGVPGISAVVEISPAMTYTAERVTRIDYASGAYKLFTYTAGVLTQLDYVVGAVTTRKTFTYNPDGTLAAITQEML